MPLNDDFVNIRSVYCHLILSCSDGFIHSYFCNVETLDNARFHSIRYFRSTRSTHKMQTKSKCYYYSLMYRKQYLGNRMKKKKKFHRKILLGKYIAHNGCRSRDGRLSCIENAIANENLSQLALAEWTLEKRCL